MTLFAYSGLRFKVLLPVGMGLALIIISGFTLAFMMIQDHLDEMVNEKISGTGHLFVELLEMESNNLERLAEALTDNTSFQKTFLANDRGALFNESIALQAKLREKHQITHFYFHLKDGTCFLRVHNPSRHSDLITRHTMNQALLTTAPSRGYELGPLGTLTLRVVVPWTVNNKLIGYIELGKEIDTFFQIIKKIKGVDLILAIEKKFLDKALWEEGLKVMGKVGKWELFEDHVVTSATTKFLPTDLATALKNHIRKHDQDPFNLVCDLCRYKAIAIPMIEVGGQEVGDMFVLYELNGTFAGQKIFFYFALLATMVTILFYLLFSIYLGKIEDQFNKKELDLEEQLAKHLTTEKELENHQQQLDELVKSKSDELEKAMAEVNVLSGFLPICASCKNIRNDKGEWEQIESYIREHSEAEFSHSYCPDCAKKLYSQYRK
jgi:hypothetical protein